MKKTRKNTLADFAQEVRTQDGVTLFDYLDAPLVTAGQKARESDGQDRTTGKPIDHFVMGGLLEACSKAARLQDCSTVLVFFP